MNERLPRKDLTLGENLREWSGKWAEEADHQKDHPFATRRNNHAINLTQRLRRIANVNKKVPNFLADDIRHSMERLLERQMYLDDLTLSIAQDALVWSIVAYSYTH